MSETLIEPRARPDKRAQRIECPICGACFVGRGRTCSKSCGKMLQYRENPRPLAPQRICSRCRRSLPLAAQYFPPCGPSQRNAGGFAPRCRECARENRRAWAQRNRARVLETRRANHAQAANDGARRRGARGDGVDQNTINEMYGEQRGLCAYCECDLSTGYHVDHVHPVARGGSHERSNLVLACAPCNQSKSASTVEEWRARCPR